MSLDDEIADLLLAGSTPAIQPSAVAAPTVDGTEKNDQTVGADSKTLDDVIPVG